MVKLRSPRSLRPRASRRPGRVLATWSVALGLGLGVAGISAEAEAAEPSTDYQIEYGKTRFGTPRLAWSMAPPINLQPERARLMLALPPEWMPAQDEGVLRLYLPTTKDFDFHGAMLSARATVGSEMHLHLSAPAKALDFDLSIMPRGAVAVLRFDPIRWTE